MTPAPGAALPSDHLRPIVALARRTRQFWVHGALAAAVVAAASTGIVLFAPRQYRSEATLHYREGLQIGQDEAANTRRVGQRLAEMLLSRSQLAKIVQELGLYPDLVSQGRLAEAVEEFRLAARFKHDQGDVFVISYAGRSPQEAQRVTARLVEVLITENRLLRTRQAEVTREFLESEKKRKAEELAQREAGLVGFLAKHPEFAQDQTSGVGVGIRGRRERASARDEPLPAPAPAPPVVRTEPAAPLEFLAARSAAEARLAAAQRDLADKRSRFTDRHPVVRTAAAVVAAEEEALRKASEELARAAPAQRPTEGRPAPRGPDPARTRRTEAPSAKRTVALETEWARLAREVAEAREQLGLIETQQFRASMAATMMTSGQSAQILVIDPAYLPARPIGTGPRKLLALGLLLSLAFGVVVAVVRALFDDVVREPEDVERLEIAPVLTVVAPRSLPPRPRAGGAGAFDLPRLPAAAAEVVIPSAQGAGGRATDAGGAPGRQGERGDVAPGTPGTALARRTLFTLPQALAKVVRVHQVETAAPLDPLLFMLADPDSPAAASLRVLRHRLASRAPTRTILVTSPGAGEGKTATAVNVALALGEGGRARVLLVEANLRTPALARLLGFVPPVCFTTQLDLHREDPTASWDVVEVLVPWLHVLALDPQNAAHVQLDGVALSVCIDWLRNAGYDHIVVDCPGVLEGADVNVVQESVDGILMVLRAGRSHALEFRKAAEQVGREKLLGSVFLEA